MKKIWTFRSKLQTGNFWAEIDQELYKRFQQILQIDFFLDLDCLINVD